MVNVRNSARAATRTVARVSKTCAETRLMSCQQCSVDDPSAGQGETGSSGLKALDWPGNIKPGVSAHALEAQHLKM